MKRYAAILCILLLAACAARPPEQGTQGQIDALAHALRALSPEVDSGEAARAARLAYQASYELAQAYQITDPPLIHNAKVNAGQRPRGLCYHWAEDIEARLKSEGFTTLEVTRAIANTEKRFFIEHSTAVLIAKGSTIESGIVIDPWREGGRLFWAPVRDDTRYVWLRREDVLRARGLIRYAQRSKGSLAPPPVE